MVERLVKELVITTNSDFQKTSATGTIGISGDVRFGALVTFPQFNFNVWNNGYGHLTCGSHFTILSGGDVTFTNQTTAFTASYSGFRVKAGGALTFLNGSDSARYMWNSTSGSWDVLAYSAKSTIDGTMDVRAPLTGGSDQAFGGSGTLRIASVKPSNNTRAYATEARSRISFGDTLTVHASSDWTTVAEGADYPLVIRAYGTPTIRTDGDWTYGPTAGFASAVAAKWRAAEVCKTAVLTVDPSGGTATFADPVIGKGTLAITNGVLLTTGGVTNTLGIAVKANGVYELSAPQTLRALSCEAGGLLRFTASAPLTVKETVNLDGMTLAWSENLGFPTRRWQTIITSKTGFAGTLSGLTGSLLTQTVETANGFELQMRKVTGTAVYIR